MRIVSDLGDVMDEYATNKLTPGGIVLLSWRRKAADPRDHFYAITGLMKDPHKSTTWTCARLPFGPWQIV